MNFDELETDLNFQMAGNGDSNGSECNGMEHNSTLEVPHNQKPTGEELAPDGGWGWVIAAGMAIILMVCFAQTASFGLVYRDFLLQSEYEGSALTTLNLMNLISSSFAGLIGNELLKKYNIKHVGILGAALFATANTTSCLMPNIPCLAISFFLQGLGIGLSVTVCNVSLNTYFVERRTTALSVVHMLVGLGLVGYPFMVTYFLNAYGFRGCLALLGALSFHGVVCMTVMDPVELHCKKQNVNPRKDTFNHDLEKSDGNISNGKSRIKAIRNGGKNWEKNNSVLSLNAEVDHETLSLVDPVKASNKSLGGSDSSIDIETGFRLRSGKGSSVHRLSVTSAVSMSSINGLAVLGGIAEVEKNVLEDKKSIRSVLGDFFEVSVLRDRVYLNITIVLSVVNMCDMIFCSFLPMLMEERGFTKEDVALTLTSSAISELGAKILYVIFSLCFKVRARHNLLAAVYALTVCKIAFLYCDSLISIIVVISISGLARTMYFLSVTLVLVEHSKIEKFSAAWGLYTIINGISGILAYPLIGLIKDWTQSYVITQYALIFGLLLCMVSWTVELLVCAISSREIRTRKNQVPSDDP